MNNIFNNSKYTRIYFEIIQNAAKRISDSNKYEKHHILPKSIGGNDNIDNIVKLTYREHFIAHWLLTKMCVDESNKRKMLYAMRSMSWNKTDKRKISSWQYEISKKCAAESRKNKTVSIETREKLSIAGKKRFENKEQRIKMSISQSGKKLTKETKNKISKTQKEKFLDPTFKSMHKERNKKIMNTEEFKRKRSDLTKKRYEENPELRKQISDSLKGRKRKKLKCPHCNIEGGPGTIHRWHFDNCKFKIQNDLTLFF